MVRSRIEATIGAPKTPSNWFGKLYDLRSSVVHGRYPVLRPGPIARFIDKEAWRITEETATFEWLGAAALTAVLQDMCAKNIDSYDFSGQAEGNPGQ
jgi:hypothetical protein